MMRIFSIPERTPGYGCRIEDFCKINLMFECLKLPTERTSHIPFEKFVIKIK